MFAELNSPFATGIILFLPGIARTQQVVKDAAV